MYWYHDARTDVTFKIQPKLVNVTIFVSYKFYPHTEMLLACPLVAIRRHYSVYRTARRLDLMKLTVLSL